MAAAKPAATAPSSGRPPIALVRTSAFRIALLYGLVFALSVAGLMAFIRYTTVRLVERETRAVIEAEIAGLHDQFLLTGMGGLRRTLALRSARDAARESIYLLIDPLGRPLEGNLEFWPRQPTVRDDFIEFPVPDINNPSAPTSTARAATFRLSGGFHLLVGRDLRAPREFLRRLDVALIWGLGVTTGLALLGGLLVGWRSMRRLRRVAAATDRIVAGDLEQRLPLSGRDDEIDRLSHDVNVMLGRIQELLRGMREVTDNVAHDLRGPLTRLRTSLDLLVTGPAPDRDPAQWRTTAENGVSEIDGILRTFETLLTIATAETGLAPETFEEVDLAALARDMADLYQPAAEDADLTLTHESHDPLPVRGVPHLLQQAIANILDNALKYTPAGGSISLVTAGKNDGWAKLEVRDSGPGIPEADRERVLQRFLRLEPARASPGNGLGLSLVSATMRLHGGGLDLEDACPGREPPGLCVRLALRTARS